MIRPICRDTLLLSRKAESAGPEDDPLVQDLIDTLQANRDHCVGMAANMIGVPKRIIAVMAGPQILPMLEPVITARSGPYEAEEGCLSLLGVRKTKRWQKITVTWRDRAGQARTSDFTGFTAQIIQHEVDHLAGILI